MSSKRKKRRGHGLLILILVLAVLVAGGGYYTLGLRAVEPGNVDPVQVTIPTGTGASGIVDILNDAGLIRNRLCAKINTKISKYENLQANTYELNKSMTFQEMMKIIDTGDFNYIAKRTVEVRDGIRLTQLANDLSMVMPYSPEEFIATWLDKDYLNYLIDKYWFLTDDILDDDVMYPLEGYLYADTYLLTTGTDTIEGFTEMCLDQMDIVLSDRREQIEKSGFTVHEFLTLTSIVTKEARADDQPKVAGVFINRLDEEMSLGSDVTVGYIFDEDRVELTQDQLDSDNPFNTRKFAGLPPGPISTVVSGAMDAVLDYTKSEDLYFFADEDGTVRYYKTLSDFEQGIEDHGLLTDEDEETQDAEQDQE